MGGAEGSDPVGVGGGSWFSAYFAGLKGKHLVFAKDGVGDFPVVGVDVEAEPPELLFDLHDLPGDGEGGEFCCEVSDEVVPPVACVDGTPHRVF